MVSTGAKITLQEFLALPEGDVTYEFVDGQAVPKVSPKAFHSALHRYYAYGRCIASWFGNNTKTGF